MQLALNMGLKTTEDVREVSQGFESPGRLQIMQSDLRRMGENDLTVAYW